MWFLPSSLIVFSVVLLCIVCPLILWAIEQTVFPFRSKPSKNASVVSAGQAITRMSSNCGRSMAR